MVPVHLATPPILTMYEVFDGLVDAHPEIYRVHGYVENRNWLGMNSYNDISTNASGVNDLPSDREVRSSTRSVRFAFIPSDNPQYRRFSQIFLWSNLSSEIAAIGHFFILTTAKWPSVHYPHPHCG